MTNYNTTGSLWADSDENFYSYGTRLTWNYKGLKVFNNTFYSKTTRKHQSFVRKLEGNFDLELINCAIGELNVEAAIMRELDYIDYELSKLADKRNTAKKQKIIKELNDKKELLINLLNK